MKMIHCADLHLDAKMSANLTPEKAKERKRELLMTYQGMVSYAGSQGIGNILIAGDLFDTKQVTATTRNEVYQSIVGHPEIRFYYLKGNHDADSFLGNLETIPDNLFLFGNEWTSYELSEQVVLTGVELESANVDRIYPSLVLQNDKVNIVTLHGQETEHGGKNQAEIIKLRELRHKGIDYLALGHVHSYQEGALDVRGTYCYPGCLEGRGFDECGKHGFVVLDIDEENRTVTHTFVPFAKRELHEITVDVSGCMTTSDVAARIEQQLSVTSVESHHMVRLVLMGAVDVECEYNVELLTNRFEDSFYFLKIKDKATRKVDYQAFALDASLKGEFIRTVMGAEDLSEEDKAYIVRYGILALAGEEI